MGLHRNEVGKEMGTLKPMMIVGNSVAVVLQNFTKEELKVMQDEAKEAIRKRSAEHQRESSLFEEETTPEQFRVTPHVAL